MQTKFLSIVALAALAYAQDAPMNLTAALTATPELANLTTYVSAFPSLLSALANATNITILAPSNEAFAKFLETDAGSAITTNDTDAIQAVLQYHVLNGTYPASAVTEEPAFLPTLLQDEEYTNVTGGQVVEAIRQGESVVFYSGLLANSTVTTADTNFTGGVIHIIDTVLTVPQNVSASAQAAGLSALVGALTTTNLASALDGLEDVTVFAPTNEAFQNIGSATANLSRQALTSILQYHVVNGTVGYSSLLEDGATLTTLGGANLTVSVEENGDVFVNSAKVAIPDVLVAGGVVHVIDNVLNPNSTATPTDPAAPTQPVAFEGASSASDNPLTSGIPTPTSAIAAGPTPASASDSAAGEATSSTAAGAAVPMHTGAIGAAALFAGAGILLNV